MGVHTEDNKIMITTEPKTFNFDLSKDAHKNLKVEIDFIIMTEFLAEHTIKNEISRLLFKYKHGNDIHVHRK